jgi:MFS transporter, PPP family, 3-phenylpropionic acid transporter
VNAPILLKSVIPRRRSEAKASLESITVVRGLWIPGSRPAAEPRNDGVRVCIKRVAPKVSGTGVGRHLDWYACHVLRVCVDMEEPIGELPLRRLSPLSRFAILYTVLFSAFGVISPFLPAFFGDRGLTKQQIGFAIGLAVAVRLVSGPIIGNLADKKRAWRGVLGVCAGVAGALGLGYLWAHHFAAIVVVTLAQSILLAPLVPVADAMALSAARSSPQFEYGWVRGAGSAAFIAASIAAGYAADSFGLVVCVGLNALLLGIAAAAAVPLPNIPSQVTLPGDATPGSIRSLMSLRAFRRLMLVGALVLGSHALHDTFAVIQWRDAGITTATASLLWSESVAAEVFVFLLIGPPLVRRLGVSRTAILAAGAGVVRWTVLGASNDIVAVMFVEPLHGLTFALFHLAAMRLITQTVPNRLAATAQAIYGTLAVGASTALLTLISGTLYGALGSHSFWVMSFLCLAAIPLADGLVSEAPGHAAVGHSPSSQNLRET